MISWHRRRTNINNIPTDPPFYACVDPSLDLNLSVIAKAKGGDSFAQLDIGKCYYSATNLTDKLKNAFDWFMLSAQQRNMEAEFRLGDMYALGEGVEKNEFTAFDWYLKSALQGYPKALTRIHNLYHIEKSMYSRGQLNSGEEEWAQDDFKNKNNIRELYEYRVQQMGSQLTKIKEYFAKLSATCRNIDDQDESDQQQQSYLILGFLFQHGYGVKKFINRAMELYQFAAEKGNVDAQYNLGLLYQQSTDMKWNYRKAFGWSTRAAEKGSTGAQRNLAFLYLKGLGTDIDNSKALYWYGRAAESRDVKAQISLACIYRNGMIVDRDYEMTIYWYNKAIEEGSTIAQNCLEQFHNYKISPNETFRQYTKELLPKGYSKKGLCSRLRADISEMTQTPDLEKLKKRALCAFKGDANAMLEFGLKYYHGDQFTQNKDVGFKWIRNAAKAGSTDAQLLIAKMYKDGDWVEQNYHTSSVWYRKIAQKKNDQAQCHLGMMYHEGLGVRKDYLEASKWLTFAANNNNSNAQLQLGILRKNGRGLRQDLPASINFFLASARQKNPEAIYQLALMYEGNIGVELDSELGLFLHRKAAGLGSLGSQIRLANFYSNANNSIYDMAKSIKYYEMAANQGSPQAKYRLAIIYLDGTFVDQDFIRAYFYFKDASQLGERNAANIFAVPIDYTMNKDIDYFKIILMFEFICDKDMDSLEYNLGHLYEKCFSYIYINFTYNITSNNLLSKTFYEKAAEKNVPEAQYSIGMIYEKGGESVPDLSKAVEYYTKAHKNGYADATYKLACMYLDGYGVSQNLQKAFLLYKDASDKGHKEAHTILHLPVENLQQEKFRSAWEMITVMAELGNAISQYQLGYSMLSHQLPQYRTTDSIHWLTLASQGGLTDAFFLLGSLYDKGELVEQDYEKAIQYYRIAADKRNGDALYELAKFYHFGKGTEKDYFKAFELYALAAKEGNRLALLAIQVKNEFDWESDINQLDISTNNNQLEYSRFLEMWEYIASEGNSDLQYELGCMYDHQGEYSNWLLAFEWYSKAVILSHSKATYHLGLMYEQGRGVRQDYIKAIELYKKSGDLNNRDALYKLGTLYYGGKVVHEDLQKAFHYFKGAEENGSSDAVFRLGEIFEKGQLVTKDMLKAIKCFSMSASKNNADAINHLTTNYDWSLTTNEFYHRKICLLHKIVHHNRNIPYPENLFLEEMNHQLGCMYYYGTGTSVSYSNAWRYFNQAKQLNGSSVATNYLTIKYENIDVSRKDEYLKKLEMLETVVRQLEHEDIYELGSIYYYGVYSSYDGAEAENLHIIIEPDHNKAITFFRMITKQNLLDDVGIRQYHVNASYFLGMVYYIDTENGNNRSRSHYYFINASSMGHADARIFLDSLNQDYGSKSTVYEKVFGWHIAQQGSENKDIAYNIAYMFSEGFGTEPDLEKSFYYYRFASVLGHSDAKFKLGFIYEHGYGAPKDYYRAIECYKELAESNHIGANFRLGKMYFYGIGVDRDYNHALNFFKIAANLGYNKAQYYLGFLYSSGYGTEKDYKKALEWYTKAAHQDPAQANFNFNLAQIYFNGEIVSKNYKKAFHFYKLAAIQGHSDAQFQLGVLYSQGFGIEKDVNDAILWCTRAANQKHAGASFNLGQIYFYGIDIAQNFEMSHWFYGIAADQGHSEAQFQLGFIYEYGHGVEVDYERAIMWYTKAADQNNAAAKSNLAKIYYNGKGAEKDYSLAFRYFKAAADLGDSYAQNQLGIMYQNGYGVEKNHETAIKWYTRAAPHNNVEAIFKLKLMDSKRQDDKNMNNTTKTTKLATTLSTCFNTKMKESPKPYMNLLKSLNHDDPATTLKGTKTKRYFKNNSGKENTTHDQLLIAKSMQNSAEERSMETEFILGEKYFQEQDMEKAFDCYVKSALKGYYKALSKIHKLYHMCDKLDRIMDSKLYSNTKKEDQNKLLNIKQYFSKELDLRQKPVPDDGHSQERLGFLYQHGFCVKKNRLLAMDYYEKAAKSDLIGAQLNLGYLYQNHEMNEFSMSAKKDNYRKAFKWYELATKTSNSIAQSHLAYMYLNGFGVKENISKAVELYRHSALKGNVGSQITLAKMYRTGKFVATDLSEYEKWYKMAAQQGSKVAEDCLYMIKRPIWKIQEGFKENRTFENIQYFTKGLHSMLREDVDRMISRESYEKLKLLAKNALVRDGPSMLRVGLNYCDGIDFPKNEDLGFKWIVKAAKTGYHEAQYILGQKYENMAENEPSESVNLTKDQHFLNASIWYKKAAKQKNHKAQCNLGLLYKNGLGVKKNLDLAEHWFSKSAEGKDPEGQYHLGMLIFSRTKPENNLQEFENLRGTGQETETQINIKNAVNLIRESSDRDHPEANYMMGLLRENGVSLPLTRSHRKIMIHQKPQNAKKYYERAIRIYKERAHYRTSSRTILSTIYTDDLFLTNISFQNDVDQEDSPIAQEKLSSIRFNNYGRYRLEFSYEKPNRKEIIYGQYHPEILIFSENNLKIQLEDSDTKGDISNSINFVKIPSRKGHFRDDYSISRNKITATGNYVRLPNNKVQVLVNQGPEDTEKYSKDIDSATKNWSDRQSTSAQLALARIYSGMFSLENVQLRSNILEANHDISFEYYKMAANNGDSTAQYELVCLQLKKSKTKHDYQACYQSFQTAADMGNLEAKNILDPQAKRLTTVNPDQFVQMLLNNADTSISSVEYQLGYFYEYGSSIIRSSLIKRSYSQAINFYEKAAEAGAPNAQYQLGCIYEKGRGVSRDLEKAFNYYNQASMKNHIDSVYKLACMYYNGAGVQQNMSEAFKLFKKAAKGGNLYAEETLNVDIENNIHDHEAFSKKLKMYEATIEEDYNNSYKLGLVYEHKDYPLYDVEKAVEYYTIAVDSNIVEAYYRLGLLFEKESRKEKIDTKLLKSAIQHYQEYISLTETTNAEARYRLAACYLLLPDYVKNYKEAFDLLTSASELGHVLAIETLNLSKSIYVDEDTISSNGTTYIHFREIVKMYLMMANQGNISAQYKLGTLYEDIVSMQDYSMSAKWYLKAAKSGHKDALYRLGKLYEQGLGVIQNYQEAVQLFIDSYSKGNYDSLLRLAKIFHHDATGIAYPLAIRYYTESAKYGEINAQYALGIIYEQGELCQQNILIALKWYTLSYLQGNDKSRQRLSCFDVDLPFEHFFHDRLYSILQSVLNNIIDTDYQNSPDREAYGHFYYTFGYLHLYGIGAPTDYGKAWQYIRKSIRDFGCKDKYRLLEMDSVEKVEMGTVAADSGDADAQYIVGKYHFIQAAYKRAKLYKKKSTSIVDVATEPDNNSDISNHSEKAIRYFSLPASKGHRNSQYYLGKIYQNGYGRAIDYEQAKAWYTESSQRKHGDARHGLGMLHLDGATVNQDYPEALLHFNRAAKEGNEDSLFQLGWMYEHGIGVSEDKTGALQYFQNYIEAMKRTPNTNYNIEDFDNLPDNITDQDDDQDLETDIVKKLDQLSIIELQELSEKGNNEASYILSQKYLNGIGIEKDHAKSRTYLRNAAYQGHTVSQEELALLYYYGDNVLKDIRMATMWFRTGVKKNSSLSTFYLAQIYHSELLDKPDFSGAFKLYKETDGIYRAISLQGVGLLYEYGDGFKTNYSLALRYYNDSLTEGNALSGYSIASMYFHGKGVKQDYIESIYWLENALQESTVQNLPYVFVEVENLEATLENEPKKKYSVISHDKFLSEINYLLGRIYYEGLGVQQDSDKSFEYFSEAKEKGKTEAIVQLDEIEQVRQQLQRIEDEKKAIKIAKLQLQQTISAAKTQLKKAEEANIQLRAFEKSEFQSKEITDARSLSKDEIDGMKNSLNKEIEESEKILNGEEANARLKEKFEGASSRLKKLMKEVSPPLEIIERAELVLENIENAKLQLKEKIQEAEALQGKIEEAEEQLRKIKGSEIQSTKIDIAKSLCVDKPRKKLEQLPRPIQAAKEQLKITTGRTDLALYKIKRAKDQLQSSTKDITEWLDKIEDARLELKEIEWEKKRKLFNDS